MTLAVSTAPSHHTSSPSIDDLLERARALRPVIAHRAAQTEREGRVSAETTRQIMEAGLYRLGQPKRFGGYEYGPSAILRLGFEIGRACTSTAWCVAIANANAWYASFWPLEAQEDIWGERPDSLVAGTALPTGRCAAVKDGYEVWGSWPFASNCENSDWVFVSALLPEVDGQSPGAAWFMTRREDLAIDHASWNVAGMQGTGSKTVLAAAPLFVPHHRVIRFNDVARGAAPGREVPGNIMADFSFTTLSAVALVAPILGAAQGALDWFVEAMRTKIKGSLRPGAPVSAGQSLPTQIRVGEASARIDAAMALLLPSLDAAEAKIRAGEDLTIAERIRVRRDMGFAARQACEAVNILFEGAGATSAATHVPIQRFWRDINAAAQHVGLDTQAIYALVGQEQFGLQPVGQF